MITPNVTLVLGAGASVPYGLPTGGELLRKLTQSDPGVERALSGLGHDSTLIGDFQKELAESRPASIDAFLESRREYENVGKAAIAYHLIKCEHLPQLRAVKEKDDWYTYLLNLMCTASPDSFSQNNLRILTYNYDRSLEYALFHGLKSRYGLTDEAAAEKMKQLPIVHLHGDLGSLPELGSDGRPYQPDVSSHRINQAVRRIKIIYEEDGSSAAYAKAHALLADTRRVIFLGFGYHEENVLRLKIDEVIPHQVYITGTALGFTEEELKHKVWPLFAKGVHSQEINDTQSTTKVFIRNHLGLFVSERG